MAGMDLGKQVGPLPLGAWIAVVGGGLGLAWYTSKKPSAADVAAETVDESGGTGEGPGLTYVPVQGTDTSDTGKPTDNDEWGRQAIDGLIALGYPAGIVNSAITKGLLGGSDYDGNK